MAALLLAMLPILILYLFLQRYIIAGVAAGAVKGLTDSHPVCRMLPMRRTGVGGAVRAHVPVPCTSSPILVTPGTAYGPGTHCALVRSGLFRVLRDGYRRLQGR